MTKQSPTYDGVMYERYRAPYPKKVAEKLFSLTNYDPSQTILEIGCGTGKGTEVLIEQGAKVHAIEPNSSMGKIAEQKFSPQKFTWEASKFEDYLGQEASFPLITSAHAFHWVDPDIAFEKCFKLLRPGGALAIYRNNRKHDDEFSQKEHQIHVELNGAAPHGSWNELYYEALAECIAEYTKRTKGLFHHPQVYEFEHTINYTADQYLGLQNTSWSDGQNNSNWQTVLTRTEEIIKSMGGTIVYPYTTILYVLFRQ